MKKLTNYGAFLALSAMHLYGVILYGFRELSEFLHGKHEDVKRAFPLPGNNSSSHALHAD
jgi:hypothetical protein